MRAVRSSGQFRYRLDVVRACTVPLAVHETSPFGPVKPKLLDRARDAIRTRHYSRRTEKVYVHWVRRFILFHGKRHPADMGAADVAGVDPKPGAERLALSLPRGACGRAAMDRGHRTCQAASVPTGRPHA